MRCVALTLFIFGLNALLATSRVFAAETPASVSTVSDAVRPGAMNSGAYSTGSMTVQILIALALVSLSIFALAWLVKRLGNTSFLQSKGLKIVSSMPLGTREKLVVIEVENKKLLLGVTAHNINTLHEFSDSEPALESENVSEEAGAATKASNFLSGEKLEFSSFIKKLLPEAKAGSKTEGKAEGDRE